MIKSGAEYITTLRDGRAVYLDGGKIEDVTAHPACARAVRSVARLYDFQAAHGNSDLMTYDCGGGARANRIWELPQSYEALVERRRGLEAWTRLHCGFIGRAPDHVASCISGMYMGRDVFEAYDRDARQGARGLLSLRTRQRSLPHLRHHQPAGRPLEIRSAADRANTSPPAWSTATRAASPCAAPRCSPPAASWPTRSS